MGGDEEADAEDTCAANSMSNSSVEYVSADAAAAAAMAAAAVEARWRDAVLVIGRSSYECSLASGGLAEGLRASM